MRPFKFNQAQRYDVARAWEQGGHLALGLWMSRAYPHFSVSQYAAAVQAAREELGDWTDYTRPVRGAGGDQK